MSRFITDFRCACGLLGCTAVAAVSLSGGQDQAQAQAAAAHEPLPLVCQEADLLAGWYPSEMCKRAWQAMRDDQRAEGTSRTSPKRPGRKTRRPAATPPPTAKNPSPVPRARTKPPAAAAAPGAVSKMPTPGKAASKPRARAFDQAPPEQPLPPVLLLGLLGLLIPAAAIGFTVRHRSAFVPVPAGADPGPATEPSYLPTIDPFTGTALGLSGSGAADTARFVALRALESPEGTTLVVIPRSEATLLFGLDEDELLDESTDRLFIPGSLDAALAYLETELAVRHDAVPQTTPPRLLLVADAEKDAGRITGLLDRYPGGLSAMLIGDWAGDLAVIDADGLVTAPPALASRLPERVPAMSRTEARDRLTALTSRTALTARIGKRQHPDAPPGRRLRRR